MKIIDIYYIGVCLLLYGGGILLYNSICCRKTLRYKQNMKRSIAAQLENFSKQAMDEVFLDIGVKLPINKYLAGRNAAVLVLSVMAVMKSLSGDSVAAFKLMTIGIGLYIVSYPHSYYHGRKTPFKLFFDGLYARRLEILDDELMKVTTQMKNLILSSNSSLSAEYILGKLAPYTDVSKPIFLQTAALLSKGRVEEAGEYFATSYTTKLGKNFARILIKLDQLPSKEFLEQLEGLQVIINAQRETSRERKAQRSKMIIYMLASFELSVITFNFIYIVLYDTLQIISF